MECIICGQPMAPWPGGQWYGNNPSPWPSLPAVKILMDHEEYRCCDDCNGGVVIPMRLRLVNA